MITASLFNKFGHISNNVIIINERNLRKKSRAIELSNNYPDEKNINP
ncbi:hypothetical protein BN1088_1433178 [Sphingobacterium sp. PM2-P1-29]|nr:hypothetical protein BN1088_1433178 [Sphingobacterium sp. PM2-P1-29]